MKTVKQFIDERRGIDGINIIEGTNLDLFIENYLRRLQELASSRKKSIDIDFLRENLKRNVKYILKVSYSETDLNILQNKLISYLEADPTLDIDDTIKQALLKRNTGITPGQYIQGRIVFTDLNEQLVSILVAHETTHAARIETINTDSINNGNISYTIPNYDILPITTDNDDYLKSLPNTTVRSGYVTNTVDENGNVQTFPNDDELTQLMEICTESIAGMLNEANEIDFENFSIPTSKMSAISYHRHARDMLIMAIGSDDFIFDMLNPGDSQHELSKLDKQMRYYKNDTSISIVEYFKIANKYAKFDGKVQRGEEAYVELRKKSLENLELCASQIFLGRINKSQDKDINKQISYFYERLQSNSIKNMILQHELVKKTVQENLSKNSAQNLDLNNDFER